ncbi:Annexin [Phytophthora infestans]|uniref:Annexin n=1 Tax=Phytophthora infestans TaxID=4787 RepID=A0A8S9VDS8_PHYIN|nr:Annexin [Phytophthora infestans]
MTLELYPASAHDVFHGTNLRYPREVDEAVQQIHGACKGLGTDEQTLIAVLGSKSPETRNLISLRYKELHQQPLKNLLKSETSGDFGRLLRMISTPLAETEAQILRDATKGMGTTESLIVQILSGRTNEEMNILKRTYFDLVGKDLAVTLNSELSGDFRKVVMALLQSSQEPYNPTTHNAAKAEEEAVALYRAGQGRLGTNEEVFIGILVKAPPEFLKMMNAVYVAKYNNNIAKAVDKEFSGDAKKSLNYLVRSTLDPYPAIAEVFEKTMKGFGTDETGLSTAIVRYQSILPYVKAAYRRLYHEELRDRISGETSGDYKKLLLAVFDAPQDPPRTKGRGPSGVSGHNAGPTGASSSAYLSTQTSYSTGGPGAAPTGGGSPAYLSTQTSYASSNTHLQSSPSLGYPAPSAQQTYGQSSPVQAAYNAAPHQTSTSHPGGYPSQTLTSQPAGYPNGSSYPSQSPAHSQAPDHSAPSYPQQKYALPGQQPPSQQYSQHSSPGQQPPSQHLPGQQQQPPGQQYQQYPAPGGQSEQQYGGQQQQPPGQSYQQYPTPGGQPPNQPYQQYPVPGQQQPSSQSYQQYPPPQQQTGYPPSSYQQYGAHHGQHQQPPSQQYQQYPSPGQHTPTQSYQQYAPGQQPPTQPYQQYPTPQQPGYPPSQQQLYQSYNAPSGQPGYPSPYGAAAPPQQQGGYPPQHQPQPGYSPYRGM